MNTIYAVLIALLCATIANVSAQATLTEVTTTPMSDFAGQTIYSSWADFNNDGFLDLFLANWENEANLLFLNDGHGGFFPSTSGPSTSDKAYHIGAAAGDYDNDGNIDLVVSSGVGAPSPGRIALYHGQGNGVFQSVTGGTVTAQSGFFGPVAWADYDGDGLLDFFVTNHGDSNNDGGQNVLFHNSGNGTFSRITSGRIVADISNGYLCLWADYDNDGYPDMFVANNVSGGVNFLYHNNRDGTFTRILTNAIATTHWSQGAVGAAWGDYNNDGLLDLFVSSNTGTADQLYRNDGNGVFTPVDNTPMAEREGATDSHGAAWGDFDNDGYLDLFVATDGRNRLFHNNGDGTFAEIFSGDPVADLGTESGSWSTAWIDYDNDGFLDLFVSRSLENNNLLYHNEGNTNAWLEVNVVGRASNRAAIGAKVHVSAVVNGRALTQMREVNTGARGNPLTAHFGLGDATNINTLHIEWPSGIVQTLSNVPPRRIMTVIEHQDPEPANRPHFDHLTAANGAVTLSVSGDHGFVYLFEASTNLTNWSWLGTRTNSTGSVEFTDAKAANYSSRFYRVSAP